MLKGIIFDMDGTITLTEELHHKAFSTVFKEYGVDDFTFEEEVKKYAGAGAKTIFTRVFESRGISVTPGQIEECVAKKKALYAKIIKETEIPVVKGVKEFVERIEKLGLKHIIATGNSDLDAVRYILNKVGLLEYFQDIVSVTEVARGKPFPDIFIEAAKRLSAAPNECVVLEDAINGVQAAKSAGIRCIALETTTKREDLLINGASSVVKNYFEITNEILYGGDN